VSALARVESVVRAGDTLGAEDWSDVRLAVTYATEVAAEVTAFAFRSGGASALYESSALQQCMRDAFAAAQHVAASPEAYAFAGRVLLNDVPLEPLLLPRMPRAV
jgi:alkylation response protein AidB-like acyl-CoA dehydrogenase